MQTKDEPDVGVFDPSHVEVLSLGYTKPRVECTKERWAEIFRGFSPKARYHASNLAAHNWDVLLIGGRVLISSYYSEGGHWLSPDCNMQDASDAEMDALYVRKGHPKMRLFCNRDGGAKGLPS